MRGRSIKMRGKMIEVKVSVTRVKKRESLFNSDSVAWIIT